MAAAVNRGALLRVIQHHSARRLPAAGLRRAAVLVPVRPKDAAGTELELLLTRRSGSLPSHAGQVAFPGGRIDPTDPTIEQAAMRETHEELGIAPSEVELIAQLDHLYTVTGYHIVPFVGFVSQHVELQPNPFEVERVFSVPFEVLLDPNAWQQRKHARFGLRYRLWHLFYDDEDIWGATAHILRTFIELLWRDLGRS